MSKPWDQSPEPTLAQRILAQEEAERADMHCALSEMDMYASTHEALQMAAKVLVDATDDFLEHALEEQEREEGPGLHIEAMHEARAHHLERLTIILLREQIGDLLKKRSL